MGNESLEHTKPLAPSFLFFFTDHDSEAPGVGGVEGLEAWAERLCGVQASVGWQESCHLVPLACPLWAKCMGGYRDKTETASQTPSSDNAAKLTQWSYGDVGALVPFHLGCCCSRTRRPDGQWTQSTRLDSPNSEAVPDLGSVARCDPDLYRAPHSKHTYFFTNLLGHSRNCKRDLTLCFQPSGEQMSQGGLPSGSESLKSHEFPLKTPLDQHAWMESSQGYP